MKLTDCVSPEKKVFYILFKEPYMFCQFFHAETGRVQEIQERKVFSEIYFLVNEIICSVLGKAV